MRSMYMSDVNDCGLRALLPDNVSIPDNASFEIAADNGDIVADYIITTTLTEGVAHRQESNKIRIKPDGVITHSQACAIMRLIGETANEKNFGMMRCPGTQTTRDIEVGRIELHGDKRAALEKVRQCLSTGDKKGEVKECS